MSNQFLTRVEYVMSRIAGIFIAAIAIAAFGAEVSTTAMPEQTGGPRVVADDGYGWGAAPQASAVLVDSPLDDGYGWG